MPDHDNCQVPVRVKVTRVARCDRPRPCPEHDDEPSTEDSAEAARALGAAGVRVAHLSRTKYVITEASDGWHIWTRDGEAGGWGQPSAAGHEPGCTGRHAADGTEDCIAPSAVDRLRDKLYALCAEAEADGTRRLPSARVLLDAVRAVLDTDRQLSTPSPATGERRRPAEEGQR